MSPLFTGTIFREICERSGVGYVFADHADITSGGRKIVAIGSAARDCRIDHRHTGAGASQTQGEIAADETEATGDDDVAVAESRGDGVFSGI